MPYSLKKLEDLRPKLEVIPNAFIRGVFYTDGSVYRRYGPYAPDPIQGSFEGPHEFHQRTIGNVEVPSDSPSTRRNKVQVFTVQAERSRHLLQDSVAYESQAPRTAKADQTPSFAGDREIASILLLGFITRISP
jgi:hypothetical protein